MLVKNIPHETQEQFFDIDAENADIEVIHRDDHNHETTTELLHSISFWTTWSVSCLTIWWNRSNGYMTKKLHWHTGMLQHMVAEIDLHQSQSFLLFSHNCLGIDPSYSRKFLMMLTMLSFKERGEKPGTVKGFYYIKTTIGYCDICH